VSGPDWREPQRACLPLARWPAADRDGWLAATRKGDFLLDDGPGAALKPLTLERHRCSYGRWLGFLQRAGRLDPAASPGARAGRAAVEAYIAELETLNAPQTVVVRLQSLSVVLRWLAPDVDWAWLRRLVVRLEARARPVRDKRARLQLVDALFDLGTRLTAKAENQVSSTPRERAQLYRDGLMIAFLSCHPLRLTNFRLLELGRHLRRADDGWWLEVEAAETKTRQPLQLPVQARLVPLLERYLQIWRPQLASPGRVARSRALWLTDQGRAISDTHAHLRITRHTAHAFGRPVNPHLFRDALATTIALARPDKIGIVTPLLGHRSLATAQRLYNLAGMATAAAAWHDALDELSRS
jgi:site-specific recombinase XerD